MDPNLKQPLRFWSEDVLSLAGPPVLQFGSTAVVQNVEIVKSYWCRLTLSPVPCTLCVCVFPFVTVHMYLCVSLCVCPSIQKIKPYWGWNGIFNWLSLGLTAPRETSRPLVQCHRHTLHPRAATHTHSGTQTLCLHVREYWLDHLVQIEENTGPHQGDLPNTHLHTHTLSLPVNTSTTSWRGLVSSHTHTCRVWWAC